MKKISILIVVILIMLSLSFVFSQEKTEDKVKDGLVNYVLYAFDLEKKNNELRGNLQRIVDDLKKIKTIKQLDSLRVFYGIKEEKENGKDKK